MPILLNDCITSPSNGQIRLVIKDKCTQKISKVLSVPNVVTYEGPTVLARAITGNLKYRITHIYGEYAAAEIPGLVESRSDTIDTMRVAPRATTEAESAIITATHYTSSANYYENLVTFSVSWDSVALDGVYLHGAGLICKYQNSEILYAHAYFTPLLISSDKEVICHWSQMFI